MGCSIHIITEIRKDGKWQYVPETPKHFENRNYKLFSLLADVRNNFAIKGFTPKGLPDDISAKKFNFESYKKNAKERYTDPKDTTIAFIASDGSIHNRYEVPETLISREKYNELNKMNEENYSKQYNSLCLTKSDKGETYSVRDAYLHGGHFAEVMWKDLYPNFDEFMQYMYEDKFDETMGEYGRWIVDFEDEDFHSFSYLTLKELVEGNYDDYFSKKYKMSKDFYDDFVAMGGVFPDAMQVTEYEPTDFLDIIKEAFTQTVMVTWPERDIDKENDVLFQGINELKNIANKYHVNNLSDIRMVFAFDN